MERNPGNCCFRILIAVITATFIAVIYVNQQALIYQMGLKLKQNNDIYAKLFDHNKILVYNVLNLRSPVVLERELLTREVELSMPSKWQVVKADHPPKKPGLNSLAGFSDSKNALRKPEVITYLAKKGPLANLFVSGR